MTEDNLADRRVAARGHRTVGEEHVRAPGPMGLRQTADDVCGSQQTLGTGREVSHWNAERAERVDTTVGVESTRVQGGPGAERDGTTRQRELRGRVVRDGVHCRRGLGGPYLEASVLRGQRDVGRDANVEIVTVCHLVAPHCDRREAVQRAMLAKERKANRLALRLRELIVRLHVLEVSHSGSLCQ